jgi:predicted amidohydrolase YtcJ
MAFINGRPQLADVSIAGGLIRPDLRAGPQTEIVDLTGRLLIPAFHDAHAHPAWGGLELSQCDLSTVTGGYAAKISEYARAHPGRSWVTGGGWSMSAFPRGTPEARELDLYVPDRPVLLYNGDHHGAWVNSVALELAGIDRHTLDPADGRIERYPDGTPTGLLHEGAMDLVARLAPHAGLSDQIEALLRGQAHLHSLGVVSWQDAILGAYGGYDDPTPAYLALAQSGGLTARVCGALWWDRALGAEQIPELVSRRADLPGFATPHVKIMLDGVAENFTAAMSEPYLGGHGSGMPFVDYAELPDYVTQLAEAGFSAHFHAIGDAAVSAALDAVEITAQRLRAGSGPAGSAGPDRWRHQIAHLQVVKPSDVERFARLGVIANMQAFWACHEPQLDKLAIPFLGPQRAQWLYLFGDLARAGAPLACGSDWPVSSANPWDAIHVAVNRSYEDSPALLPDQALDLARVLTAYTLGSAKANNLNDSGLIAPGWRADLAVLDRNPFELPSRDLTHTKVIQTYAGGSLVHAAA